jgi:hypothetical protein
MNVDLSLTIKMAPFRVRVSAYILYNGEHMRVPMTPRELDAIYLAHGDKLKELYMDVYSYISVYVTKD